MALAQLAFDDNAFNSVTALLTSMDDTKIGLRQTTFYFSTMTRFLKMFTTSTVGKVLPQFIEDYGEGKKLDLHFSPSHRLFVEQLPGSKMTGVYIDKNGGWKFVFNMIMHLSYEKEKK